MRWGLCFWGRKCGSGFIAKCVVWSDSHCSWWPPLSPFLCIKFNVFCITPTPSLLKLNAPRSLTLSPNSLHLIGFSFQFHFHPNSLCICYIPCLTKYIICFFPILFSPSLILDHTKLTRLLILYSYIN